MGRGIRRKKFQAKKNDNNGNTTDERYETIEKDNKNFFEYYRRQGFISNDDEWKRFEDILRQPLPTSFRVQGCLRNRQQLIHELETRYFKDIAESNEEGVSVPKELPWYKGAFQTETSRATIRSHPCLERMHNWLVNESELGNVSRQEAVSMIPPLLLDVRPEHAVLDMCAAPGSKTMQIIEQMHDGPNDPLANDVEKKRCYLLVHQILKRMHTTNCVVICEDATTLPDLTLNGEPLKFDRVLCDVICSGDGTIRKNVDVWKKWGAHEGIGLHRMQLSIAKRGCELLKVGGKLVYSTCSMNPIEDEAVVAELLRQSKGALRLVDTSTSLPELKRLKGTNSWKVISRAMKEYKSVDEVEEGLRKAIIPSMFPPSKDEANSFNLHHCMRIMPHLQNTGGFFIAVLEKTAEVSFEKKFPFKPPVWKKNKLFRDDPFGFFGENDERWQDLRTHYGLSDDFRYRNLFNRASDEKSSRTLFFVNDAVKVFIEENQSAINVVNAGMKVFGRVEQKFDLTRYRISQEGVHAVFPFMRSQKVHVSVEDILKILKSERSCDIDTLESKEALMGTKGGCVVLFLDANTPVCAWIGQKKVVPYVSKEEKVHILRLLGADLSEEEKGWKNKRREKAQADRDAAEKRKVEQSAAKKPRLTENAEDCDGNEEESREESEEERKKREGSPPI